MTRSAVVGWRYFVLGWHLKSAALERGHMGSITAPGTSGRVQAIRNAPCFPRRPAARCVEVSVMAWFPQQALNDGVHKREVFGWAMYDFANSGYTTVVLTPVFNAYFVGVVAADASWATFAWTSALALSSLIVMLTMPTLGAYADLRAAKKRLLALTTIGCIVATAALAEAGPGDVAWAVVAIVLSNVFYSYGESLIASFLPEL